MSLSELQREVANHPIYRDFVFANIKKCCDRMFPIAKKALGDDWDLLLEDFLPHTRSPYFWKMPKDLVDFVQEPRLKDLLRFEWLKTEVHRAPHRESKLAHFHYPVHKVPFDALAAHRGDYFLFIFRQPVKLNVCFIEIDPLYISAWKQLTRVERA